MSQHRGATFSRWISGLFAVFTLLLGAGTLSAQATSGKIQGTVLDPNGQPVVGAQVNLVGTSLGAVTGDKGYYFINSAPAGVYTVRATFIGLQPAEKQNVRVLSGQTLTLDFKLAGAVQLGTIAVTAEAAPIVPRDQVTSKTIVTGETINNLPTDDVRSVLALQPGVVESGSVLGLSIRGGRPGEAAVYVDGALVRSNQTGASRLNLGTNALEEASITTGAFGAEFGDAQSGVIAFNTRAGGPSLKGSLAYETDEPFGNSVSVGLNRWQASLGGPLVGNLTFFVAGTLQGQVSPFRGMGADVVPTYIMAGVDTTVTEGICDCSGTATGDSATVVIPRFAQFSGVCDPAANYGFECQGQRLPLAWSTGGTVNGKLQYTYGSGSRISFTFLQSQDQNRDWPGGATQAPQRFSGSRSWSQAAIFNLTHQFASSGEHALSLNAHVDFQSDNQISGVLDPAYEQSHRSPKAGVVVSPMQFLLDFDHFSDDTGAFAVRSLSTQADWDRLVQNIRSNQTGGTRTPYLDRTDLRNAQPYRLNPWGLATGYSTEGIDFTPTLYQEKRTQGWFDLDWQADRYNRFKFGAGGQQSRVNFYRSGVVTQTFMDAYTEEPKKYDVFGEDHLDLGDVVIILGLRYDYFNTGARLSAVPGRIFTLPTCDGTTTTECLPVGANPADSMVPVGAHTSVAPHIQVSFPVTDQTDFRLSYSHQVQSPDFNSVLTGINNDLSFTNTNDIFGRDVTFGKTIMFEFGIAHRFSQDLVLDVAAYNKDKVSDLAARILPFYDPLQKRVQNINVLTNADFGNVRGVDMSMVRRIGDYFNGSLSYTFQISQSTGSDPFSYLNTIGRQISGVTGDRAPPPQAILPTDDNRTHTIAGAVAFSFPSDFGSGILGSLLRNGGAFARFRFASGLPYTRLRNDGNGQTAPRLNFALVGTQIEPVNSSQMPWLKIFDLKLTKGIKIGGTNMLLFGDIRNLFNFRNVNALFAETGDVTDSLNLDHSISPEISRLENAAGSARKITVTDKATGKDITAVDLRTNTCDNTTGTSIGPVDCVLLRRAEARFGNGDGIFDANEYRTAFKSEYLMNNGPQAFLGQPRSIRIGLELNF
jgi:hypothetical protein